MQRLQRKADGWEGTRGSKGSFGLLSFVVLPECLSDALHTYKSHQSTSLTYRYLNPTQDTLSPREGAQGSVFLTSPLGSSIVQQGPRNSARAFPQVFSAQRALGVIQGWTGRSLDRKESGEPLQVASFSPVFFKHSTPVSRGDA